MDIAFSLAIAIAVISQPGRGRRAFLFAAGLAAAFLLAYNIYFFGNVIGGYGVLTARYGAAAMFSRNWPGIAGILVSNRGILVFCPFLILLIALRLADLRTWPGIGMMLAAYAVTLAFHGSFHWWDGGSNYGPRYATDGLPILIAALAGPLARLRTPGRVMFAAAVVWGFALQAIGAFCATGYHLMGSDGFWNVARSSPVQAARAGLAQPDFLPLILPHATMRAALPPESRRYGARWDDPPPASARAGETIALRAVFRNESAVRWSSLPGWLGRWSVRVAADGTPQGRLPAPAAPYPDAWLVRRLDPHAEIVRAIFLRAPDRVGPIRICVGLVQTAMGPLEPENGPLCANISILPGRPRARALAQEWLSLEGPSEISAGRRARYQVGVRNVGQKAWGRGVFLFHYWQTEDGRAIYDAELMTSRGRIAPGDGISIGTRVKAPAEPGRYRLIFTFVKLGVAWFSRRGSSPLESIVTVR
jgi:hypothetical protein